MATVSGTVHTVNTMDGYGGSVSSLQVAQVLFTVSGTYAQADNGILSGVDALIEGSRRNGKTVTLVDAMCGHPATKASDPAAILGLKTVAVSTNDVTFEITNGDFSTEFTDATAVPDQARPFAILVSFTEA
jgi:hypothetical protein